MSRKLASFLVHDSNILASCLWIALYIELRTPLVKDLMSASVASSTVCILRILKETSDLAILFATVATSNLNINREALFVSPAELYTLEKKE